MLEHQPVYTAGRRTSQADRPLANPGIPVIDVDRGGKITWHGPGQLVGYPIVALAGPVDVIAYVRTLEEALIRACAEAGVATTRVEGRSGVWITGGRGPGSALDRKVAAIGIRVARGVTMHGFALNCDCDLGWFDRIVPCGIRDAGVTSLSAETGRTVTVADMLGVVERHLADALGATAWHSVDRSEEHTSELQSHVNLVCRLPLEKKKYASVIRKSAIIIVYASTFSVHALSFTPFYSTPRSTIASQAFATSYCSSPCFYSSFASTH